MSLDGSELTDVNAAALTLEQRIEREAYALGFDLVGFVQLGPAESAAAYDRWVAEGLEGEMHYMARDPALRHDTRLPAPGTVSAIVVGMNYGGREPSGPVARYARGDDYHDVMKARLQALHQWLSNEIGQEVAGRAYVDTAPILERDLARRAGLGWFGKNTNLISPSLGSFFFIGSLFLSLELTPSEPFEADRCGRCTRCLDACPTDAFRGAHVLDARRCISYLTIELRGAIDEALRAPMGELLYGCDVCQDVCPYNRKFSRELSAGSPFAPRASLGGKDARTLALEFLGMSKADFSATFKGSAMKRAKSRGLRRNAAVVLGNVGSDEDVPALSSALSDEDSLVRAHVAWALGRIGSAEAVTALHERCELEADAAVRVELDRALRLASSSK